MIPCVCILLVLFSVIIIITMIMLKKTNTEKYDITCALADPVSCALEIYGHQCLYEALPRDPKFLPPVQTPFNNPDLFWNDQTLVTGLVTNIQMTYTGLLFDQFDVITRVALDQPIQGVDGPLNYISGLISVLDQFNVVDGWNNTKDTSLTLMCSIDWVADIISIISNIINAAYGGILQCILMFFVDYIKSSGDYVLAWDNLHKCLFGKNCLDYLGLADFSQALVCLNKIQPTANELRDEVDKQQMLLSITDKRIKNNPDSRLFGRRIYMQGPLVHDKFFMAKGDGHAVPYSPDGNYTKDVTTQLEPLSSLAFVWVDVDPNDPNDPNKNDPTVFSPTCTFGKSMKILNHPFDANLILQYNYSQYKDGNPYEWLKDDYIRREINWRVSGFGVTKFHRVNNCINKGKPGAYARFTKWLLPLPANAYAIIIQQRTGHDPTTVDQSSNDFCTCNHGEKTVSPSGTCDWTKGGEFPICTRTSCLKIASIEITVQRKLCKLWNQRTNKEYRRKTIIGFEEDMPRDTKPPDFPGDDDYTRKLVIKLLPNGKIGGDFTIDPTDGLPKFRLEFAVPLGLQEGQIFTADYKFTVGKINRWDSCNKTATTFIPPNSTGLVARAPLLEKYSRRRMVRMTNLATKSPIQTNLLPPGRYNLSKMLSDKHLQIFRNKFNDLVNYVLSRKDLMTKVHPNQLQQIVNGTSKLIKQNHPLLAPHMEVLNKFSTNISNQVRAHNFIRKNTSLGPTQKVSSRNFHQL